MNRKTLGALVLGGVTIAAALIVKYGDAQGANAVVRAQSETGCTSQAGGIGNILVKAEAFNATLSTEQREIVNLDFGREGAIRWSNLPAGMVTRNGLTLGAMDADQKSAALALVSAATSSCGKALFDGVVAAETVLNGMRPQMWDPANYYISFVGEPSADETWILQVGGHHLAYNFTFNGAQTSATPLFDGVEPVSFTHDGVAFEPLAVQQRVMSALSTAVSGEAAAQLSGTFRDVTRGPGRSGDTEFPISYPGAGDERGVAYSNLSAEQKALVRTALEAWVELPNSAISEPLMATYTSEAALANTYIGVSGENTLTQAGSYVRIDGPRVWIEFIVQNAAGGDGIHFHTIWRDKLADYGGAFRS